MSLLATLRESRAAKQDALDAIPAKVEAEERSDFDEAEAAEFARLNAEIKALDERIAELSDAEERKVAAAKAAGTHVPTVKVKSEPLTYQRGNGQSYFRDLALATVQHDRQAAERLARHGTEMEVVLADRDAKRERMAEEEMRGLGVTESPFERRANPDRTAGRMGEFVPPAWMIDEYVALLRAGRPFANLCRGLTLPDGTDSINLPKVTGGSSTAVQTDAGAVSSTDMTSSSVQANVRTIAGQQDVAIQLIEQSPISFDEVVFTDLVADYNRKVDQQLLSGSGLGGVNGGQLLGLDNIGSVISVTYTDASPTMPEAYVPFAQALSQVASQRFAPVQAFLVHPRRWYWGVSALDSTNRPLFVPNSYAGLNPMAVFDDVAGEGPVGTVMGVPVILDANITTTDGVGTNQDRVYAVRPVDYLLWEGSMRTRALPEVLSGTLQVRLQVYNYIAFMPHRYSQSTAIVSGTGLVAPSGF